MSASKRAELAFYEIEPKIKDADERERKVETALENFTALIYEAVNAQRGKEGKGGITKDQARRIVIHWAKNR